MSLINKKSLYDRHHLDHKGKMVGKTSPKEGDLWTNKGRSNSPFATKDGSNDHMEDLLTKSVYSKNTQLTYPAAPKATTPYQDLDGGTDAHSGQKPFDGVSSPNTTLKQFGGPYKETGPIEGYY